MKLKLLTESILNRLYIANSINVLNWSMPSDSYTSVIFISLVQEINDFVSAGNIYKLKKRMFFA